MFKRKSVVKYVDGFGIEHAAKVEAAIGGLHRLDSSIWTEEEVWDRMFITVEVNKEPTTHTGAVERLKRWIRSNGRHPSEQAKKEELRRLLLGTNR